MNGRRRRGWWTVMLLGVPGALAMVSLAWGISRLLNWGALDEVGRLLGIVLTVLGGAGLLILIAVVWILRAVGRALGEMKKDAANAVEGLKYMANMPNKYGANRVERGSGPGAEDGVR